MIAAYTYASRTRGDERPCLILENHPLIGGEAKRNEFIVRGQRLIGPQGARISAAFPRTSRDSLGWYGDMWRDIKPARTCSPDMWSLRKLPAEARRPMDFPRDNYMHYAQDVSENYGFFFDKPEAAVGDGIRGGIELEGTPWLGWT